MRIGRYEIVKKETIDRYRDESMKEWRFERLYNIAKEQIENDSQMIENMIIANGLIVHEKQEKDEEIELLEKRLKEHAKKIFKLEKLVKKISFGKLKKWRKPNGQKRTSKTRIKRKNKKTNGRK